MKKLRFLSTISFLSLFIYPVYQPVAQAHSGKTNNNGCHNNRQTGGYHCHNSQAHSGNSKTTIIPRKDYNCSDFNSQTDAQKVLNAFVGDPYGLDRDKDGIACEALR